jgi:hypothetical protein
MKKIHAMNQKSSTKLPYFSFNMFDQQTNEKLTVSDGYDRHLKETIELFENQGYLNNTMLIVMSDHGSRIACKFTFFFIKVVFYRII